MLLILHLGGQIIFSPRVTFHRVFIGRHTCRGSGGSSKPAPGQYLYFWLIIMLYRPHTLLEVIFHRSVDWVGEVFVLLTLHLGGQIIFPPPPPNHLSPSFHLFSTQWIFCSGTQGYDMKCCFYLPLPFFLSYPSPLSNDQPPARPQFLVDPWSDHNLSSR